ncbi:MAG: sugar transferase [Clostridia bacterium]|nr:sugar transferase [Clostridia bacterium]
MDEQREKQNTAVENSAEPTQQAPLSEQELTAKVQASLALYQDRRKKGFAYGCYLFFKRAFDIVTSILGMVILSPVILLCLLVKWLEDFHNPVYVSKRVGKDGKVFKFYKIRSMCVGAEEMKKDLVREGKNEADGPAFKMKDDPRITKVGRFLRKTSMDELLQFWNILIGSMSVVGPRPPLPGEVEEYNDYQTQRLLVKGGLLCYWQIRKNRNDILFDEWVRLDLEYIDKQSFWLDMKIIFKGAFMVLFDRSGE